MIQVRMRGCGRRLMRSHSLEGNKDDGLEASDAHRRCHLACEPAAAPLPTCGTRTTSRIGAVSGSLRRSEVQRMIIARHVLR